MILLGIIFLSVLLAGCSHNPASDGIPQYGGMLYEDPDRLLHMVLDEDTLGMNIEERNAHHLMRAAAMLRTGQGDADTAALAGCERFYEMQGCGNLRAAAMMLRAEEEFINFRHDRAAALLMRARDIAEDGGDNALKSSIYSLLYRINRETGCKERSADACRRASDYAAKSGYGGLVVRTNIDMASMLMEEKDYEGARRCLEDNVRHLPYTDRRIRSRYYRAMGEYYMLADSIRMAGRMLETADSIMPDAETFFDIALLHEMKGDRRQTVSYCYSAITADRRGDTAIRAYNKIIGNMGSELSFENLKSICQNLNMLYLRRAELASAIEMDGIQAEFDEADDGVSYIWYVLPVLILSASSAAFMVWDRRRRLARRKGDPVLMNEEIVYELHRSCSSARAATQEQWIMLHRAVNRNIPFFLARLHRINDLSARDINICILTRMHFSPSEIGILTGMSPQNVTNSRARLLTKIFNIRGGAAEFDRRITEL